MSGRHPERSSGVTTRTNGIRRRMLLIASVAYLGGALALLLWPSVGGLFAAVFGWLREVTAQPYLRPSYLDVPANIALFVPLGMLAVLWVRRFAWGLALGVVLSSSVELIQSALPARDANVRDVVCNVIGAAIGAFVARMLLKRAAQTRRGGASAGDAASGVRRRRVAGTGPAAARRRAVFCPQHWGNDTRRCRAYSRRGTSSATRQPSTAAERALPNSRDDLFPGAAVTRRSPTRTEDADTLIEDE